MTYKNFDVAMYLTTFDIEAFGSIDQLKERFSYLEKHIKISKVYIETYRKGVYVSTDEIKALKTFFDHKGITCSGGVTLNSDVRNGFETFCYARQDEWEKVLNIISDAAEQFDEVILDDFYFFNCKCEHCLKAKGQLSWTEYRMTTLNRMSQEIMAVSKHINPNINMIVKYPNWYESYSAMGYDVKTSSQLFDHGYTGTEVRDTHFTQQTLQGYGAFSLMTYINAIKPDFNQGGWFDSIDCGADLKRYLEQLYLTLLSGGKEVTLFSFGSHLLWDDLFTVLAGYGFERMDTILPLLNTPKGLSAYKPFYSDQDPYLHSMLGMIGIPIMMTPNYEEDQDIFLTACAATDPNIVDKIKSSLNKGQTVTITSGLVEALQDQGEFSQLIQVRHTHKTATITRTATQMDVAAYHHYDHLSQTIELPILAFHINDYWQEVVGFSGEVNYPILLKTSIGKGRLNILAVPSVISDLKHLPVNVLNFIRGQIYDGIRLDGASDIVLIPYGHNRFVLMSFSSHNQRVSISVEGRLKNLESGQILSSNAVLLKPRSMTVFECLEA